MLNWLRTAQSSYRPDISLTSAKFEIHVKEWKIVRTVHFLTTTYERRRSTIQMTVNIFCLNVNREKRNVLTTRAGQKKKMFSQHPYR